MRFAHAITLATVITSAAAGCDVQKFVNSVANSEQASRGFRALVGALNRGESQYARLVVDGTATSFRDGDSEVVDVDGSFPCPDGGTASVEGEVRVLLVEDIGPGTDPEDLDLGFDFSFEFDGCGIEGVTIDGNLDYTLGTDTGRYEWRYAGRLEFSGEAEGSCEIDMTASADDIGEIGERTLQGEACGFGAEELDLD